MVVRAVLPHAGLVRPIAVLSTAALFAATPASILLIGSATFSEEVPVRVPATAVLLDEHGRTPASVRALAPVAEGTRPTHSPAHDPDAPLDAEGERERHA